MTSKDNSAQIQHAADLLQDAACTIAFTGAGISTPSGIPDFRSARTGLWTRYDPMQSASLRSFLHQPDRFYGWLQPLARDIVQAEPNPAHHALAELEAAGKLDGIVTQNIDNLHQRAGSETVIEVHGHLREAICISCGRAFTVSDAIIRRFALGGEIPLCDHCGGRLKPDVVLFGEELPGEAVQEALTLFARADLVLVAGSSLIVVPASYFPMEALERGAKLIIVNLEPTPLDYRADVILSLDVADALPAIVREVLGG